MTALRVLCWALIFILRLRFPPGSSIATTFDYVFTSIKYTIVLGKHQVQRLTKIVWLPTLINSHPRLIGFFYELMHIETYGI